MTREVLLPWERPLWSGRPWRLSPRLSVERMRYNEKVQAYNTSRRQFPANLTAKMFSFKEYPFFEAPAEAKQVPKVNFGKPTT